MSNNNKQRDRRITEITKWITSEVTDEGKIKVLQEQIIDFERCMLFIKDRIAENEQCISSQKRSYDVFYKDVLEKREGIKLLSERIKEKRKENNS